MHELGVVFKIIDNLKEVAAENDLSRIDSVTIRLGEVSTVIPEYLLNCWNWACKRTPLLIGAGLRIETIPAVTYCEDCRQTFPTVKYGKICPLCGSPNTWLMQGNEFLIKEIEVPEPEDSPAVLRPNME